MVGFFSLNQVIGVAFNTIGGAMVLSQFRRNKLAGRPRGDKMRTILYRFVTLRILIITLFACGGQAAEPPPPADQKSWDAPDIVMEQMVIPLP